MEKAYTWNIINMAANQSWVKFKIELFGVLF